VIRLLSGDQLKDFTFRGTALHYAVVKRNLAAVQLLIAAGADPNARTAVILEEK
jgi:hypothetical protein